MRVLIRGVLVGVLVVLAGCGGDDGGGGGTPEDLVLEGDLPDGTEGTAYDATLTAKLGTTVATATWSVSSGFPPGLGLASGHVTGTPTAGGTYSFAVTAAASGQEVTKSFSVVIAPQALGDTPTITSPLNNQALPAGTVGVLYSVQFVAAGGTTPYAWSLQSGAWPAGLQLDAATGVVSGTPAATATATPLVVRVTAGTAHADAATMLTIAPAPAGLEVVTPDPLPDAVVSLPYTLALQASGGTTPYSWRALSGLPAGLTLSTAGALAGTATAASTAGNQVQLELTGGSVITRSRHLEAVALLQLFQQVVVATPLTVGQAIVPRGMDPRGGRTPYRFDLNPGSPALPPGLQINATTGQISGVPTVAGTTDVVVRVQDASRVANGASGTVAQTATTTVHLVIVPPPAMVTLVLAGAGGGVVQGTGGINCERSSGATTGTCTATSFVGASITLTPSPDGASVFAGWQGCGATTTGPCTLTLTAAATTVTGTFTAGTGTVRLRPKPSLLPGAGVHAIAGTWRQGFGPVTAFRCEVDLNKTFVVTSAADPYAAVRTGDCDLEIPLDATVTADMSPGSGYEYTYVGRLQTYRYVPTTNESARYLVRNGTETECTGACEFSPVRGVPTTMEYRSVQWGRAFLAPRGNGFVRIYSPSLYLTPGNPASGFLYDCRWETATGPQSGRCQIDARVYSTIILRLITNGAPANTPDYGHFCAFFSTNADHSVSECDYEVGNPDAVPTGVPDPFTPYAWEPIVTYP